MSLRILFLFNSLAIVCLNLNSQPFMLDPSYGNNGIFTFDANVNFEVPVSYAIQSDEKVIVCGSNLSLNEFFIARINKMGSLDTTFGINGITNTNLGGLADLPISAPVIQHDGKILVAGSTDAISFNPDMMIIRYLPDGEIDESFGDSGIARINISNTLWYNNEDWASSLSILDDGKVLVAGTSTMKINDTISPFSPGMYQYVLVRLLPNGQVDSAFGNQGNIVVNNKDIGWVGGQCRGMIVQHTNRHILVGTLFHNGVEKYGLAAFNIDGTIDSTFGNSGYKLITDITTQEKAESIILRPDDKIIIAGTTYLIKNSEAQSYKACPTFLQLLPDGLPDTSFGNNGFAINEFEISIDLLSASLLPNGKIILVGGTGNPYDDFVIARLNKDGSKDYEFGTDGHIIHDISNGEYEISNLVLPMADNNFIVIGTGSGDYYNQQSELILAKYLQNMSTNTTKLSDFNPYNFFIYPNPTISSFTVELNLKKPAEINLEMTDMLGRRVLSKDAGKQAEGTAQLQFNIDRLPKGMYILRINLDGETFQRKIVKIN